MDSYECLHCAAGWDESAWTVDAVRERLAAHYGCAEDELHPEDLDLGQGECPSCGFMGWVRKVPAHA